MSKLFESQFSDGTGNVSIQYEGTEGASEAQVSADCNCGEDRTIAVSMESEDGSVKKTLTVNQEGVREQFIPAGETEGIICSDGLRFLTIKEKYADSIIECCNPKPVQDYLVYRTTEPNEEVQLMGMQECANKITLEGDVDIPITGTGALKYTFAEPGDHKVWIEINPEITEFSNLKKGSACFLMCDKLISIPENLFTKKMLMQQVSKVVLEPVQD